MQKVFDKNLLGIEDIEIGNGVVTQTRNGSEVELEAINGLYEMGLLKDLNRDKIPNAEYLWFSGFYEEGDKGQGIYVLVPEDAYYYTPREDDTGLYIKATDGRMFERDGSWDKFGPDAIPVLREEKRHWVMFEWFGGRPNDSTYNCFPIMEYFFRTTYIKTIECDANQHYYFKQYTDITFERKSSLEVRGNNAYLHFDIFAGQFEMTIPTILDYIIMRDINYASIVPVFAFPADKCKYFNIYHNSNIYQPNGKGYLYKKDDSIVTGTYSIKDLPIITKVNLDDNALVNKAYVDKIYNLPENLVNYEGERNITGFKQLGVQIERNGQTLDDLEDDDIITQEEFAKWLNDNIDALLPEKKWTNFSLPSGFEYLQFKAKFKKFMVGEQPYYLYQNYEIIDEVMTEVEYILDEQNRKQQGTLTEVNGKWKYVYQMLQEDQTYKDIVYFENATWDGQIVEDFLDEEVPEALWLGTSWRLNKEENEARYWEKL